MFFRLFFNPSYEITGDAIKIIKTPFEMQRYADKIRCSGKKIVFVPTMGFLHEGHLSLIREGKKHGDEVVVSIFVNPSQFGPGEDLDTYPQSFEKDCEQAEAAGAAVIFGPRKEDIYQDNFQTYVTLEFLPQHLCGLSRPVFLKGVATVVTKLFNIVKPHAAVFGEKDFQQLQVIRQMVKDLNFDIDIIGGPLIREPDGLAMSSRNSYLTREERSDALCLYQALTTAQEMVKKGERRSSALADAAEALILSKEGAVIDYIAVCSPETLDDVKEITGPSLMALAVKIGKTRLIDNIMLIP